MYMSCLQVKVTSNGNQNLPGGTSFPGTYNDNTPGIHFNIYGPNGATYKAPGPDVWNGAARGSIGQIGCSSSRWIILRSGADIAL